MTDDKKDTASLLIKASAAKIYQALTEQSAIRQWKALQGMYMEIFHYNARPDGTYRISLCYDDKKLKGKSGDNSDIVNGRFLEMIPSKKIVEAIRFESTDPTFASEMIMTTELTQEKGGTIVTFSAENVPDAISPEDHRIGMNSSLENLSRFVS